MWSLNADTNLAPVTAVLTSPLPADVISGADIAELKKVGALSPSTTFTGVTRATSSTSAAAHAVNDAVSESWTERDASRSNAGKYNFERFNFDGND